MLAPGDLGFPGFSLIFFFLVCPVIGLIIRRQWRIAEERNMEILKLVAIASEEAERVEIESSVEYETVSVARQYQCALCFSPTTTRCSRCKSVRYCSGKCQIIHWRQGHKEECRPPIPGTQPNVLRSTSSRKAIFEDIDNDLELGSLDVKPYETSYEEARSFTQSRLPEFSSGEHYDEVRFSADGKGVAAISKPCSRLIDCATASSINSSIDVAFGEFRVSSISDKSEAILLNNSEGLDKNIRTNDTKISRLPASKFNSIEASVNSFSCSAIQSKDSTRTSSEMGSVGTASSSGSGFRSSKSSSTSEPSKVKFDSTKGTLGSLEPRNDPNSKSTHPPSVQGGNDILSGSSNRLQFSFNLSGDAVSISHSECSKPETVISEVERPVKPSAKRTSVSEKIVMPLVTEIPILHFARSASVNNNRNSSSNLSKPKAVRSLSYHDSNGHLSSATREPSVLNRNVSEEDNVQKVASKLSESAHYSQNAIKDLKVYVQKFNQQFKETKLLKHHAPALRSDAAAKHNYKMLFPYELFVKLYKKEKADLQPCGLTNCGNSCYANAVLQCLAFTRPLTAYFLQGLHSKACPKQGWCFTCEFENLILKAKEGISPLTPIRILSQLQNTGSHLGQGREEDAHEFLRYAIDKMQSGCLKEAGINAGPIAEETTLMGLVFGGYLRSKIKCMKCHGKSERNERMMDLTVEIDGDIATLEEALRQYTATEVLDGQNKYHCSRCKSYEKAKKKLTVLEAPNVLTIALKRFKTGKFGKLNKTVRFPEYLDLAPYMSGSSDKSPKYSLYAVVVHLDTMNAAFSGHYVCYVKNSQGKWFKIDDSLVKSVELDEVLLEDAYMLLYARCSPKAPGLIRSPIATHESKIKRTKSSEPLSSLTRPPSSAVSRTIPSIAHCCHEETCRINKDRSASFESIDSFDRKYQRISRGGYSSSSDNSSLFSCSDEGSCSTESTRDSFSTDEFLSDYIFGETGYKCPIRVSEDSSSSSPSPETSWTRGIHLDDRGNHPFAYSDTTNRCIKLNHSNSSREGSDLERIAGWGNSFDVRSGVSLRRSIKERTTQSFY